MMRAINAHSLVQGRLYSMVRRTTPFLVALALALAIVAPAAAARSNVATLISVDEIRIAAKPGPATANCSNDGAGTNQYELTGWAVASGGQTAYLTTSTIPSGLGSVSAVTSALQASFNAWTGAPRITVTTGGTVTRYTANRRYELLFGRTGGSSIAVTYTWRWSDGAIESDTVFNSRLPWFMASSEGDGCYEAIAAYDLRNIATHEFGHTYGLGHSANARFNTMYPYGYTGETLKWTPESGDAAGINAIY
jgi:hypothetical protein